MKCRLGYGVLVEKKKEHIEIYNALCCLYSIRKKQKTRANYIQRLIRKWKIIRNEN
jgi:hypothetical protein